VPDDLIVVPFLKGDQRFAWRAGMVGFGGGCESVPTWSRQQKNNENDGEKNQGFELSDEVPDILTSDV
jgi:hypothetical protein